MFATPRCIQVNVLTRMPNNRRYFLQIIIIITLSVKQEYVHEYQISDGPHKTSRIVMKLITLIIQL